MLLGCQILQQGERQRGRKQRNQTALQGKYNCNPFWLDGIDSPHSSGSREEGEQDKKKRLGGGGGCACVLVLDTFNEMWSVWSVKLIWQTSLSRHWALTIKPREPVKELVWTYSANRQQTGKSFEGYGKCSRGQWSEIQNATTLYYGK